MREWLFREYRLFPLWKSYPEFYLHFSALPEQALDRDSSLHRIAERVSRDYVKRRGLSSSDIEVITVEPPVSRVLKNNILVDMGQCKCRCYTDLGLPKRDKETGLFFFYIFTTRKIKKKSAQLIKKLIDKAK